MEGEDEDSQDEGHRQQRHFVKFFCLLGAFMNILTGFIISWY